MKISKLYVKNFRKIESLELDIPDNCNVICFVGENGSGKSSLITNIYSMLRNSSDVEIEDKEENKFSTMSGSDICKSNDSKFYAIKCSIINKSENIEISKGVLSSNINEEELDHLRGIFPHNNLSIEKIKRSPFILSNPKGNELSDIIKQNILLYRPAGRFEIASYEQTKDEYLNVNISTAWNNVRPYSFVVSTGLDEIERLLMESIFDGFLNKDALNHVYNAFMHSIKLLNSDFGDAYITRYPHRKLKFERLPSLSYLSSGQLDVLVTIMSIINQTLYFDIKAGDAEGIVFIDEIDKNLHPELQEKIIHWLIDAFPKIQFVITTHSPFFIRSLDKHNSIVIKLPGCEVINEDFRYWGVDDINSSIFEKKSNYSDAANQLYDEFESDVLENRYKEAIEKYILLNQSPSMKRKLKSFIALEAPVDFSSFLDEVMDA